METTLQKSGSLQNQKAIIMGGSSGIGLAVAQAASAKNAEIIIVSSNRKRIDEALEKLPKEARGYTVDVTNETQIEKLFDEIGAFDHLIFTAGENLMNAEISNVKIEAARKYFEIRYWGAVTTLKYAAPYINQNGSVTLTSGIASNRPGKGWALGASICSAMEGFTRAMAMELAPIRVNAVSPGVVKTNLWSNMNEKDREQMYKQIGDHLPVKRVGLPEDIAKTYLYLMEQPFGTGQVLIVDGGTSLV